MPSIEQYVRATLPDMSTDVTDSVEVFIPLQMAMYDFTAEVDMSEIEKGFVADATSLQLLVAGIDRAKGALLEAVAGPTKAKFQEQIDYMQELSKSIKEQLFTKAKKLGIEPLVYDNVEWIPNAGFIKAEERAQFSVTGLSVTIDD